MQSTDQNNYGYYNVHLLGVMFLKAHYGHDVNVIIHLLHLLR